MVDWTLIRDADQDRLWGAAWIDLVCHYDVALRLTPLSPMPVTFVAQRNGEIHLGWWTWNNKTLREIGLEETDLVDYLACCRVEPCDIPDTPFL